MLERIKRWLERPKPNQVWYNERGEVVVIEVRSDDVVFWNKNVYASFRMDKKLFKKQYRRKHDVCSRY